MKTVCGIAVVDNKRTPEEVADSMCKAITSAACTSEQLIKGLSAMNAMLSKAVSASEKNF